MRYCIFVFTLNKKLPQLKLLTASHFSLDCLKPLTNAHVVPD